MMVNFVERCIWCEHTKEEHTPSAALGSRCQLGCGCNVYESIQDVKVSLNALLESFDTVDVDTPIAMQAERIIREYKENAKRIARVFETTQKQRDARAELPIPMFLTCPDCNARHIDEGEFATKIHHTHSCQSCGLTWRPAVVPTVGVQFLPGFKSDSSPASRLRCQAWSYPGHASWDCALNLPDGRQCALDAGHHGNHELTGPWNDSRPRPLVPASTSLPLFLDPTLPTDPKFNPNSTLEFVEFWSSVAVPNAPISDLNRKLKELCIWLAYGGRQPDWKRYPNATKAFNLFRVRDAGG